MGNPRSTTFATMLTIALSITPWGNSTAAETHVMFDIPDSIECRDVTPEKCAAAHPNLMAIEGKFRLSARITRGSESEVVDFLYMLISPSLRLKIHDYLPNTTLESALSGDNIEVAETTENSTGNTEDAHIGYKIFNLGAARNQTNKTTDVNHYKQIVPKALVLASGTTNREHGVFFKLRPSNGASLEGAKEFTFLAIVPKVLRGDWCTLTCGPLPEEVFPAHVRYAGGHRAGAYRSVLVRRSRGECLGRTTLPNPGIKRGATRKGTRSKRQAGYWNRCTTPRPLHRTRTLTIGLHSIFRSKSARRKSNTSKNR